MPPTTKHARRRFRHLSSNLLIYFVLAWSAANLILVLFSTAAFIAARIRVSRGPCQYHGVGCDFTRWGFYLFAALSAAISSATAGLMALNTLLRPRNSSLDPVWVFRGVFFTLMPLMTMVYIGWSTPDKPPGILKFPRQELDIYDFDVTEQLPLRGIGGAFILDVMDPWKETIPAFVVIHINLFLGALLAGYSTAVCHAIVPLQPRASASGNRRRSQSLVIPPVA
ncbi:hypothetical protein TGAM01_v204780 [Trichoderma gamsii]|uniref:Integral membrane protein n=1 Tax=Trichoderma gamsii TaxID=398673 RepID=A0A2P4ZPU4_9HYPO|nr:hypothetical protein TGAM01_v204780 [Trichoderma gamsii]PON26303.1 hypothetical protein TGAM01_v204780 [Trichoderma gamsii]